VRRGEEQEGKVYSSMYSSTSVYYSMSGTHQREKKCLTFVVSTQVFDPERKRENVESTGAGAGAGTVAGAGGTGADAEAGGGGAGGAVAGAGGRPASATGGTWSSISGSYALGGGGGRTWSNSSDLCNLTASLLAMSPRKFLCTSPPQVSFAYILDRFYL
jgi:hypothetical protein